MSAIPFITEHDVPAGRLDRLAPTLQRLQGDNPGPFTFTGTGVFILGGGDQVVVIDPGPDSPGHRAALLSALDGRAVSHILITHHHLDHTACVDWLQQMTGAQTYGYGRPVRMADEDCGSRMEAGDDCTFCPDVELQDGDRIEGNGFTVEALHTPGHASNHMCYATTLGDDEDVLFCGDHVMAWSTSVVSPPDGHMGDYIAQLIRIRDRDFTTLYPTHGAALHRPRAFLDAYIDHRRARDAGVLRCVETGLSDIRSMVAELYPDLDRKLIPAACHSVLAHLITLREQGRVRGSGEDGLGCLYRPLVLAAE